MNIKNPVLMIFSIVITITAVTIGADKLVGQNLSSETGYDSLMTKAQSLIRLQQWNPAIELFKKTLEIKASPEAYGGIARANFGKARIRYKRVIPWRMVQRMHFEQEAGLYFQKAIEADPENPAWSYELAELYIFKNNNFELESAVTLLEEIRAKSPNFRDVSYLLARTYEMLGKSEKAGRLGSGR